VEGEEDEYPDAIRESALKHQARGMEKALKTGKKSVKEWERKRKQAERL
jgi:hypothetical protein